MRDIEKASEEIAKNPIDVAAMEVASRLQISLHELDLERKNQAGAQGFSPISDKSFEVKIARAEEKIKIFEEVLSEVFAREDLVQKVHKGYEEAKEILN